MDFPAEWVVLGADDFDLATPVDPGRLGMDLMVQVRPNGRIMDHFRVALGGSGLIEASFNTRDVFANQTVPEMEIRWQIWPRDIAIRRNMASSEWIDLVELIDANDALAYIRVDSAAASGSNQPAETPGNEALLAFLTCLPERGRCGAALRWTVAPGPCGSLELNLECLPASAAVIGGKPTLRG